MKRIKTVFVAVLALTVTTTFLALMAYPTLPSNFSLTETFCNLLQKQGVACASEVNDEDVKLVIKPDFGVYSIAFSPDGKYIAAGGTYSKVCIWDVETGKLVRTLNHNAVVQVVTYSPDGKYLATGTWDTYKVQNNETVNIWDTETGNLLHKLSPTHRAYNAPVRSMDFSPDSKLLAVSYGGNIRGIGIFKVSNGKLYKTLEDDRGAISLKFSLDGENLVYANYKGQICMHKNLSIKCNDKITTDLNEWIYSIDISPDGKFIAVAGADKIVKIWDAKSKAPVQILKGHTSVIRTIAYGPNGRYLVSGSDDRTIRVWDINKGEAVRVIKSWPFVFSVAFGQDTKFFAAGGNEIIKILKLSD